MVQYAAGHPGISRIRLIPTSIFLTINTVPTPLAQPLYIVKMLHDNSKLDQTQWFAPHLSDFTVHFFLFTFACALPNDYITSGSHYTDRFLENSNVMLFNSIDFCIHLEFWPSLQKGFDIPDLSIDLHPGHF
jgi:hypothetical protein